MHRFPISFAKTTFNACQVLLVYFIISATRMLVAECEQPQTVLAALYFARLFGIDDLNAQFYSVKASDLLAYLKQFDADGKKK